MTLILKQFTNWYHIYVSNSDVEYLACVKQWSIQLNQCKYSWLKLNKMWFSGKNKKSLRTFRVLKNRVHTKK